MRYRFWRVSYGRYANGEPKDSMYYGLKLDEEFEAPDGWRAVGAFMRHDGDSGVVLLLEQAPED